MDGVSLSRSSSVPLHAQIGQILVDLIESGLDAKEREKVAFFELADRLAHTSDRTEQKRLKEELARMTFGEP